MGMPIFSIWLSLLDQHCTQWTQVQKKKNTKQNKNVENGKLPPIFLRFENNYDDYAILGKGYQLVSWF